MDIFKRIKKTFSELFTKFKTFLSIGNKVNTTDTVVTVKPTTTELKTKDINEPYDKENIKNGEIGAYIIFDKSKGAVITDDFIKNLKEFGVNIVYFNTPRNKSVPETYLSYDEWLNIFEQFKSSGIKLMLYIYEAMDKKDAKGNVIYKSWTEKQIKSISNHESFYGWIAEDEVGYTQFKLSKAWITKFHSQKFKDGTRKWPNMSICFFPKSPRLINQGAIGGDYDRYLETYANSADIFFADMYPTSSVCTSKEVYDISGNGKTVYSDTEGGKNWCSYLQSQMMFANNHPESVHRLYMHVCKHVTKDDNGKLFVARYKPTEITVKIQSYANLMAGSNGLMLFVVVDVPGSEEYAGFTEAAFSADLKPNKYTYNLLKDFYNSAKFKNFKKIMVNLHPDKITYYNRENVFNEGKTNEFIEDFENGSEVFVSYAHNKNTKYCIILNASLENKTSVKIKKGNYLLDLEKETKRETEIEKLIIVPGEIIVIKKPASLFEKKPVI